jgi:peptide/nickel transport system ATP-binding protein
VVPALLTVRDLVVQFATEDGDLTAADGISFDVPRASTVALVGESGCGKSVTALSIMRLLPEPPARIAAGQITFEGRDVLTLRPRQLRELRGARISMVFQDPLAALHPLYSIGAQLSEALRLHLPIGRREARRRGELLLQRVGFPEPARRFADFPHELSGGMRQRVMIAIALACKPALLIADEPTTALDMVAAREITALLAELRRELDMSLLLISHDIGMVSEIADRIVVLYAGQVVESGRARSLLGAPRHPYTEALLRSLPPRRRTQRRRRLTPTRLPSIAGSVPELRSLPRGCRFSDRCPVAMDRCHVDAPELVAVANDGDEPRLGRCWLLEPTVEAAAERGAPRERVPRQRVEEP